MAAFRNPIHEPVRSHNGHIHELFRRHHENPILTAADWPYAANTVFNPAATRLADGTTLLLCRVEDRRGISHLTAARSQNGIRNWQIDPTPTLMPDEGPGSDECWGIEDPRITFLDEFQSYAVTYTGFAHAGPHVKIAMTKDFVEFERLGSIMPPDDKDAALFPTRIGGRWALIHRPVSPFQEAADIWISYSPDLVHWGNHQVLLEARRGAWWDAAKVGLNPPPLRTEEGWLLFYHGVRRHASGSLYRLGIALLDLEDPTKIIRRGNDWVFGPEEHYERVGDVRDVVFPCGYTLSDDNQSINMYYGAADTSIALAFASIPEILEWLLTQH